MAVDVKTPFQASLSGVDALGQQSFGNESTLNSLRQQKMYETASADAAKAAQKYNTALSNQASLSVTQTGGGVEYSSNFTSGGGSGGGGGNYAADFSGSGKVNTAARQGAISAASKYIGTPYSWGGGSLKGPSRGIGRGARTVGFDCSGLVRYAYAQVGKSMPRHSSAQFAMGKRTSVNNLRPGDLVGRPGHIAIYIGNGKILEAPSTGKHVRVMSMKSSGMTDARGWFGIRVRFKGE